MDQHELKERMFAITGLNTDDLIEQVRTLTVPYLTQKAKVDHMTDYRKARLAMIIEQLRESLDGGDTMSETKLDTKARASKNYRDYLKRQYHEKVKLAELEGEYYAARNTIDMLPEVLKTIRAEAYMNKEN